MPRNKVTPIEKALSPIESGMTLALGGFVTQGLPLTLIEALRDAAVGDLTIYCNDGGWGDVGVVELVRAGLVRTLVCCYVGFSPHVSVAAAAGDIELILVPQGTLLEMLRCGGAGLGGFLTPTGVGTKVAEDKEQVVVDGKAYLWERAVRTDVAFVRAHAGDTFGNLCCRGTGRNYNTVTATCADYVVAEVEHIYCVGELEPEKIHVPGILVDAVVPVDVRRCGTPV